MASEHHDWTVPAPLRALLWWPPVAFVLALLDPTAAAWRIAVAGAALAVLGVLGGAIARRMAARTTGAQDAEPALVTAAATDPVTPLAVEQHAA
jgi:hypothetical protein